MMNKNTSLNNIFIYYKIMFLTTNAFIKQMGASLIGIIFIALVLWLIDYLSKKQSGGGIDRNKGK